MRISSDPRLERDFRIWYHNILSKKKIVWSIILMTFLLVFFFGIDLAIEIATSWRRTGSTPTWFFYVMIVTIIIPFPMGWWLSFIVTNKVHRNSIIRSFKEHYKYHSYETKEEVDALYPMEPSTTPEYWKPRITARNINWHMTN